MFKLGKWQLVAIGTTAVLAILLWFAPKKTDKKNEQAQIQNKESSFSFEKLNDSVKTTLNKNVLSQIVLFEQNLSKSSNSQGRISSFDSLSNMWKRENQLGLASWYKCQSAILKNNSQELAKAGELSYSIARFSVPQLRSLLMEQAIVCLEKALALDSNNESVKVSLASCYVEGTPNPMKGITMLREIVQKDSTNVPAQLQLGLFAMQSGQYEKAIDRFLKLKKITPNNNEVDLYLAQAYAESGKKAKAIEVLESFLKTSTDNTINAQVSDYITQLKNTN